MWIDQPRPPCPEESSLPVLPQQEPHQLAPGRRVPGTSRQSALVDPITQLREMGFEVHVFNCYHFRVEARFDVWLPRGKWYDRTTGERGKKPLEQIPYFINYKLREEHSSESENQEESATTAPATAAPQTSAEGEASGREKANHRNRAGKGTHTHTAGD